MSFSLRTYFYAGAFALAFCGSTVAMEREALPLTNGWDAVYCNALSDVPEASLWGVWPNDRNRAHWNCVDFAKASAKPEKRAEEYNGMWLKKDIELPSSWSGRRIFLEFPVPMRCDVLVFVNGEKVGEVLRPGGVFDLTQQVRFDAPNALSLYLTRDGTDSSRGITKINRGDQWMPNGFTDFPVLRTTGPACISDVFADTSVQEKKLILHTEIDSTVAGPATFEARILDPSGAVVKTLSVPLALTQGLQTIAPEIAWPDPHFWAFGDGYLYTCEASLKTDFDTDAYPAFTFGFRELWRKGKELYMNGHPLHLRTTYSFGAFSKPAMQFLSDVGYTAIAANHDVNAFPQAPTSYPHVFDDADSIGMGLIISSGAVLSIADDTLPHDPATQETFRSYVKHFHRKYRNHPSLIASYVSQMIICDISDFPPDRIGQTVGGALRDQVINKAREINREFNPNILYYSHSDGPNADMSSGNIYFNWTPQQEMDEWLSEWSTKGIYPWHGSEFETPYNACWWYGGGFAMTEFLAATYGERAYDEEPAELRDSILEMTAGNRSGHGGSARQFFEFTSVPLFWEWRKMAVQNINRYWRGYGLNGGLIWFNLNDGYGAPVDKKGQLRTGHGALSNFSAEYTPGVRPSWANRAYDVFQPVLQNFCGFLAGAPEPADKTHTFTAGETIEKQAIFIWDGNHPKTFSATWTATLKGQTKPLATGRLERTLTPGTIERIPFSFTAPEVTTKTAATLSLTCSDGITTSLDIEIYPAQTVQPIPLPTDVRLAILDPDDHEAALLQTLGLSAQKIASTAELGDATHLIVGRYALTRANLDISPAQLAAGLKILVMPQTPTVWQSLGFLVQDTYSRTVFLRDKNNPAFAAVTPDTLAYWRGSPTYELPLYSRLMEHSAPRGPIGTRRHIVAGLLLQVPERAGYIPLIDAEYDLNFAALLRFEAGTGSLTTCTLELEERVGKDPAATTVAHAILSDFIHTQTSAPTAIACEGAAATELANELGFATAPESDLLLVGPDATTAWPELHDRAAAGKTILIYANPALARAAGLTTQPRALSRAVPPPNNPLFRGFTPSLLRWRDALLVEALTPAENVHTEGLFAELPVGRGRVIFCQADPLQIGNRFATKPDFEAIQADKEWLAHIGRIVFEKLGAPTQDDPDARNKRGMRWYDGEAHHFILDTQTPLNGQNGHIRVAGVDHRKNTWTFLQNEAREGHTIVVLDNVRIAEAAGFEVAPRERITALDAASLGPDFAALGSRTFALSRSIHRLTQAPEGYTISADGLLAEGPCGNGRIVFLQLHLAEWDSLEKDYTRLHASNRITAERDRQRMARLLTNLGAKPAENLIARALHLAPLNPLVPLPASHVLGPFATHQDNGEYQLNTVFSKEGERMTIAGDYNPNIEFPLPQGGTANWRPILAPDASGMYDFASLFPDAAFPVTYSIVHLNRREAGPATLKVGVDWRCIVWVNGKEVFRTLNGANYPRFEIPLTLNKGDNVISFKVGPGRAGNKLWAIITAEPDPTAATRIAKPELDSVELYHPVKERPDPYVFIYW